MSYCPHCSASIPASAKICPHCKKSVEIDLIKSVYTTGSDHSATDKKARRKLWFREKSALLIPVITLLGGFILGALLIQIYDQIQFAAKRSDYENRISELESRLKDQESRSSQQMNGISQQLQAKNEIITILTEEIDILGKAMNFTNRWAQNSTITTNSLEEEDYYRRNMLYLSSQFSQQEEKLKETEYQTERRINLLFIPQIFSN